MSFEPLAPSQVSTTAKRGPPSPGERLCPSAGASSRDPRVNELLLFYNTKQDTLKLFWLDGTGSQELSKSLPRGGFLLPAPKFGETFVTLEHAKLNSLFRS